MPTKSSDSPLTAGARLAELWASSETTAEQLASSMLLPEDVSIEQVIDGTYEPTISELLGAAEVLEVPVAVLTGDLPTNGHLGVSLRLGRIKGADALGDPLAYANRLLDHRALLDSWLGVAASPLRTQLSRVMLSRDTFGMRAGMVTADRVRAVLGLGDDEPVVDMVDLVESLGIPVASLPLPPGVHGLNVRDLRSGGADRVVLVSSADVWSKQRYTLAHELCHALYDDEDQVIVDKAEEPEALPEWRAEAFARHLLLPTRAVRAAVRQSQPAAGRWQAVTASLMTRFGVSRDATVIALQQDGGVTSAELEPVRAARVEDLMSAAGLDKRWRKFSESENVESGSPMLVARAAEAYGHGWVRADLVADLMRADVKTAERELAAAGWQPAV